VAVVPCASGTVANSRSVLCALGADRCVAAHRNSARRRVRARQPEAVKGAVHGRQPQVDGVRVLARGGRRRGGPLALHAGLRCSGGRECVRERLEIVSWHVAAVHGTSAQSLRLSTNCCIWHNSAQVKQTLLAACQWCGQRLD